MSLSAGTRLGPYEILAPIGAGGMGEVYKARDTRLDRVVAIKMVNPRFIERFEREARAIAALNHPNICALHDIGADYLVMEYIEGSPLKGPLPPEKALPVALQIAAALEAAHAKGITHRDLKPANILVSSTGIKLLDFGLAKLSRDSDGADTDATQTIAGTVLGTAAYMSPEQAAGKPADARSDIFSFGAVLYELLSGRRAFQGETQITTMAAILHKDPEPLQAPPNFAGIVTRCLRKSPGERFQSAAEVKAALEKTRYAESVPHAAPSIAVLPFVNMSADKEHEYFSDGLSEEIINALTKLPGLRVIARTSAFRFRGEQDLRKVGETLQVTNVLEGSVRRAGNRLRITAQLIKVADDSHLWSERYDRELTDIFAIQDDISSAIAAQLKISLTGVQPAAKRAVNPAAYEACLEGRHHLYKLNPSSMAKAVQCYERALAVDSDCALAYQGLAQYYAALTLLGLVDPREFLPKAKAAAQRALELDPAQADSHASLGVVSAFLEFDWTATEQHFRRALALNPAAPDGRLLYAVAYLRPMGRLGDALVELEHVLEQDPLAVLPRSEKAFTLLLLQRYDAAAESAQRALDIDPSHVLGLAVMGMVRSVQKRFEEAIAIAERSIQLQGRWSLPLVNLASVRALAGHVEQARALLAEIHELSGRNRVSTIALASIYANLNEKDSALEWLEKAVEQREPTAATAIRLSPVFDPLRSDPRYSVLLHKMNLA